MSENLADSFGSQAFHGGGLTICGIAPKNRLAHVLYMHCDHCEKRRRHIRVFSGSGWYEDSFYCLTCGEDWGSGYHPFERGWRKRAIANARSFLPTVVPRADFYRITSTLIREEMRWEE